MLGGSALPSVAPSLIIRNRWPSGDTSYVRCWNATTFTHRGNGLTWTYPRDGPSS